MVTDEYCEMVGKGYCPRKVEVGIFRSKWSLPILIVVGNFEILRFNQLHRKIDGISSKILSENLSDLELKGLISRKRLIETRPHVEYMLTQKGMEVYNKLSLLTGEKA